jgi:isoquinoline 1-oxidoreductase beta subunit
MKLSEKLAEQLSEQISGELSRRALLTGGLAGGFLLAFHLPVAALPVNEPVQPPDVTDGKFAPNALIRIDASGQTTLVMPQVEMGQGVYTAIAMILAEELDADFAQVTLEHAPPNDKLYGNPLFGIQATGNSNSVPGVVASSAQCRRRRPRHAGPGCRQTMAGRAGKLHEREQRGHA